MSIHAVNAGTADKEELGGRARVTVVNHGKGISLAPRSTGRCSCRRGSHRSRRSAWPARSSDAGGGSRRRHGKATGRPVRLRKQRPGCRNQPRRRCSARLRTSTKPSSAARSRQSAPSSRMDGFESIATSNHKPGWRRTRPAVSEAKLITVPDRRGASTPEDAEYGVRGESSKSGPFPESQGRTRPIPAVQPGHTGGQDDGDQPGTFPDDADEHDPGTVPVGGVDPTRTWRRPRKTAFNVSFRRPAPPSHRQRSQSPSP